MPHGGHGAVGVQRVEEEHVADQRPGGLLLRHEALEVRRVGVDQRLQEERKQGKKLLAARYLELHMHYYIVGHFVDKL